MEPDIRLREALGVGLEDGLEADLGQVRRPARAGGDEVRVGVPATPYLEASEAPAVPVVRAVHPGVPGGRLHVLHRGAAGEDLGGHAELREDLHRPLVEHVGLRQDRRPRIAGNQQRRHPHARQQHRRSQPGPASADDQHRHLDTVHHSPSSSSRQFSMMNMEYPRGVDSCQEVEP